MAQLGEPPAMTRLKRKLKNPFKMAGSVDKRARHGPGGGLRGGSAALKHPKKKGKYAA